MMDAVVYDDATRKAYELGRRDGYGDGLAAAIAHLAKLSEIPLVAGENPRLRFDASIKDLGLIVRTYNCLKRKQVHTVGDLLEWNEEDLLNIHLFGQKGVDEVKAKLRPYGYQLRRNT